MKFETDGQRVVYEKVAGILHEEFGKRSNPDPEIPRFILNNGSATVIVFIAPINDKFTAVRLHAWVVMGAVPTLELYQFLLKTNLQLRFGAFSIDDQGDIAFTHTLIGESCDTHALMWALMGALQTVDDNDDVIVQRFGGTLAKDHKA
jgi:type III secretion system-like peptide-binding chaperone